MKQAMFSSIMVVVLVAGVAGRCEAQAGKAAPKQAVVETSVGNFILDITPETAPNHANYDEATANPFPVLPDPLTLKNGKKVTSADVWNKQRRAEIIEEAAAEYTGIRLLEARVRRPEQGIADHVHFLVQS